MKTAGSKSRYEKALQEIEQVLQRHDAQIFVENHGFLFVFGGKEGAKFRLMSTDTREDTFSLPREVDEEKLVLDES